MSSGNGVYAPSAGGGVRESGCCTTYPKASKCSDLAALGSGRENGLRFIERVPSRPRRRRRVACAYAEGSPRSWASRDRPERWPARDVALIDGRDERDLDVSDELRDVDPDLRGADLVRHLALRVTHGRVVLEAVVSREVRCVVACSLAGDVDRDLARERRLGPARPAQHQADVDAERAGHDCVNDFDRGALGVRRWARVGAEIL